MKGLLRKEIAMPHVALDHVLFVLIALVSPAVDKLWLYPWLTRATEAGVPGARRPPSPPPPPARGGARAPPAPPRRAYLVGILGQWIPMGLALALWASR